MAGNSPARAALYPVASDAELALRSGFRRHQREVSPTCCPPPSESPPAKLRGTLDGTARIGGYIGTGTGPSVTGAGHVDVRGGLLFQTKLFSGLSAILSKIIPDFTLFAQTDASGDFTIRNSRVPPATSSSRAPCSA